MRVLVLVKANKDSEKGVMPPAEMVEKMGRFNEELAKAGALVAADGLHPSSKGARVRFSGEQPTVIDGPFAETRELVAGFWIWKVKSLQDAIAWLKKAPFGGGAEVEIRPIFEMEDFLAQVAPELKERGQRLRKQMEAQKRA